MTQKQYAVLNYLKRQTTGATTENVVSRFDLNPRTARGALQFLRLAGHATRTKGVWRATDPMIETTGGGWKTGGGASTSTPSSPGVPPSRPSTQETS